VRLVVPEEGEVVLSCSACATTVAELTQTEGLVYVLSNGHMPGLVKVGFTTRAIDLRLTELNAATGVPEGFSVEALFDADDPSVLERMAHEALAAQRVNASREFFRCSVAEALRVLEAIAERQPLFLRSSRQPASVATSRSGRSRHNPERQVFHLRCAACGNRAQLDLPPYETHGRCPDCKTLQPLT
jgi:hypothetical protein